MLHAGSGELHTVTGVRLVRSHSAVRESPNRLSVGLIGAEAMLRLFTEQEANERAFSRSPRFPRPARRGAGRRPAELDPLGLSFQLKLLWLSGYLPHVGSCAECGSEGPFVGYSARAGGTVCETAAQARWHSLPTGWTA
jgi:recombinational DNA repair protein (RecF pathway)